MHAAIRSSAAAGAAMITAGALVAAPSAPAPEVHVPQIQMHQIELAALPAGALVAAVLENQVQNATLIFQSAVTFATTAVEAGVATATAPITFVRAATAPGGTPLTAIGVTAASILNPVYLAGSAVINPVFALGNRILSDSFIAAFGAANIGEEVLGLVLSTGLGVLAAPVAAADNLAQTGDITQALNAGVGGFNYFFQGGVDRLTSTVDWVRDGIYTTLKQPLYSLPPLPGTQQAAATVRAAAVQQPQAALPSAETLKTVVKDRTGVSPQLAAARTVADSLKPSAAGTSQKGTGKHALGADNQSSSAGASHSSGHSGSTGKHAKRDK